MAQVHGAGLNRMLVVLDRPVHGSDRHLAAVQVGRRLRIVDELDAGQAAVGVNRLGHARQVGDVAIVPQARLGKGRDVGRVVNVALLGADDAPAALGLDAPHMGHAGREDPAHAVAVGHLVEPVGRPDGPDLDWFEEHVIPRFACHHGSRWIILIVGGRLGDAANQVERRVVTVRF
jgi:hypothetical protein